MYTSTHSFASALEKGGWSTPRPGRNELIIYISKTFGSDNIFVVFEDNAEGNFDNRTWRLFG
jgi:hypothetical protein